MNRPDPGWSVQAIASAAGDLSKLLADAINAKDVKPTDLDNHGTPLSQWLAALQNNIVVFGGGKPTMLGLDTSGALDDRKSSLG